MNGIFKLEQIVDPIAGTSLLVFTNVGETILSPKILNFALSTDANVADRQVLISVIALTAVARYNALVDKVAVAGGDYLFSIHFTQPGPGIMATSGQNYIDAPVGDPLALFPGEQLTINILNTQAADQLGNIFLTFLESFNA